MTQNIKKKVAWLYTHLLFWTGGTRFILEVAQRLQKNWDITVIVEKASPEIKEEFSRQGVEVKEIGFSTSTNLSYWLLFPWMLLVNEKRIKLATLDTDIIIAGIFPMNVIASRIGKPTIQNSWEPFAFFHDTRMISGFALSKRLLINMLALLYSRMDINATRKSDIITTLNHSTEEWIRKIYDREVVKTYMGVDTDFFRPVPVDLPAGKYEEKIVLHSTDYTLMKGTVFLIEALPLITRRIKNVKIIITHTSENQKERLNLLKLAEKLGVDRYIEFIGTVPYSKLPEYYSLAHLVAFTGHPESIGTTASLTVLEAMACETPVVRSIGCTEEVENGVSGILVDPRNKVSLAEAIIKILIDEELAKKMGREGRRRVSTLYNWNNTSRIFSDVILELIAAAKLDERSVIL